MKPRDIWAMYYAGIVSIQMHPRNDKHVDLEHAAYLADRMLVETLKRFKITGDQHAVDELPSNGRD